MYLSLCTYSRYTVSTAAAVVIIAEILPPAAVVPPHPPPHPPPVHPPAHPLTILRGVGASETLVVLARGSHAPAREEISRLPVVVVTEPK